MSHISTVTIPLRDVAMVKRALEALGLDVHEGGTVEVYDGESVSGVLTVRTPGRVWERYKNYGLAFQQTEDGLVASGDWAAVFRHETMQGFGSQQVFLDAVGQKHSQLLVEDRFNAQGFTLEETESEGRITLTARRYR